MKNVRGFMVLQDFACAANHNFEGSVYIIMSTKEVSAGEEGSLRDPAREAGRRGGFQPLFWLIRLRTPHEMLGVAEKEGR